jgi:hypothetical protein
LHFWIVTASFFIRFLCLDPFKLPHTDPWCE